MSLHSIAVGMCCLDITIRCAAKASQIIKINISKAINDRSDPIEEMTFHFIKASG
jgi:hypothetical protein